MRFPLSHSRSKILKFLRESELEYSEKDDTLTARLPEADLLPALMPLMDALSSVELGDVRVIFQRDGQILQLSDFFEIESLDVFLAKIQGEWLIDMIDEKRLTTWFQPILAAADGKTVFANECLLRGVEGEKMVYPKRILDVARGAGLMFQLDQAARRTAITNAARHGLDTHIFINFTPTSIYDPVYCLQSTVRAADEAGFDRNRIIFEVIESEHVGDVPHLKDILDYYRSCGFRVALDDVGSGYSGLNMLSQLRPDFIKLDRELISNVHEDSYKATIARKMLEAARELGIESIAEGIERDEEFHWLQTHGADYVQGYYFARPAAEPPMR